MNKSIKLALTLLISGSMCGSLTGCPGPAGTKTATGTGTTASTSTIQPQSGQGVIKGTVYKEGIKTSSFRLFATTDAGSPASGAKIVVKSSLETKETSAKDDGSFEIAVKAGADYTVEAAFADETGSLVKKTTTVKVPAAKDPQIIDIGSLVTRRTGSIQGVIELEDGKDAEGVDIFIAGTSSVGKAHSKGRFALTGVDAGTWKIVIQKAGYETAYKETEVKSGRPALVSEKIVLKKMDPRAGIKGKITNNQGAPIPGVIVTAFLQDKDTVAKDRPDALDNYITTTDIDGNYELLNLPTLKDATKGIKYSVQYYRAFYEYVSPVNLELKSTDMPKKIDDISMTSNIAYFGQIKGTVLDELGNPIDGAVVQTDPQVTDQKFTDAKGNFTLDRVVAGEYQLSIAAGGYCTVVMPVALINEKNKAVEFGKPIILEAHKPLANLAVSDEGACTYAIDPVKECYADNPDIEADPTGATVPGISAGALIPAGSVSRDERKCRCSINLSGMNAPDTGEAIDLTKSDITIIEDGVVKAFKFTPASESGRALPVDIGIIIDTTGSMGEEISGVKSSAVNFVKALYEKNIDAGVGSIAYADGVTGNPAGILPGTDPATMTITGFEPLSPFSKSDGMEKMGDLDIKAGITSITNFITALKAGFGGYNGGGLPEGPLDSIMWAFNLGTGKSYSGNITKDFGWRERAQKAFIVITDAPAWEKGGSEISPASEWTIAKVADTLKGKAVVHTVSPAGVSLPTNTGDTKGLAVALASSNFNGDPSKGTGGTWIELPKDGNVDLTTLPLVKTLGKSVKLEYVSLNADPANVKEHQIRVIVKKNDILQGESTFTAKY